MDVNVDFVLVNDEEMPPLMVTPDERDNVKVVLNTACLLYTSPSPRDRTRSRMPSSA